MITLLILLILFIGAYAGYKKGIVLQLLQTIGYAMVYIFALDYYKLLSEYLYLLIPYPTPFAPESNPYRFYDESLMLSLDLSYYDILAFIAIFLVGWVVVRFLVKFISYTLENVKLPEPFSGIGGALLGFGVNYLGIFYVLFLLTTIPYDMIQDGLAESFLAEPMIASTPVVTNNAYQRFVLSVHDEANQNQPTMDIQPFNEETDEE